MASTSSRAAAPIVGVQQPRIFSVPDYVSTSGHEAVELAAMAGLHLDEWQQIILINALGERADMKWAAFEVGVCVPRQNGKGGILEGRELAGLFLLGEPLIIHSAHQFDTSLEAFRRLLELIEGRDEFSKRVKRVSRSHGEEGIELYGPAGRRKTGGQRIRFRTRTKGGGRGFSGACVIFDEAMIFPSSSHGAILPILSAQENPQAWYLGSAVDKQIHEDGIVFARIRERGLRGDDPSLMYAECSLDEADPSAVDDAVAADPAAWAVANPALGIRITEEYVAQERRSLDRRTFAVERLGVGDWPDTDDLAATVMNVEKWLSLVDPKSILVDPIGLAFDVSPDRSSASIGAGGRRRDGLPHIEVVEHRRGTGWIVDRLVELNTDHSPIAIVCDAAGPAASLLPELEARGIEVAAISAKDHANACGRLFDLVEQSDRDEHTGSAISGQANCWQQ
jgi:hypothetical protein